MSRLPITNLRDFDILRDAVRRSKEPPLQPEGFRLRQFPDVVDSPWWGAMVAGSCSPAVGTAKFTRAEGTYPNLTAIAGAEEVDVIVGQYPIGHRFALIVPSGVGIEPKWTALPHIPIVYSEPDPADLSPIQDDGGGARTGCG